MIKKKLVTITLLVLTMALFCSCGKDKEDDILTQKQPVQETQKVENTDEVDLKVENKYKEDTKITLSSSNDSIDIYMPTNLAQNANAVTVYPFVEGSQPVDEFTGKNYGVVNSAAEIDAILAKLSDGSAVYYYFCENAETDNVLETINPDGTIVELEHKGAVVKTTGLAQDDIYSCYSVFTVDDKTAVLLILEGDHEFSEDEVKSYIDRIDYK